MGKAVGDLGNLTFVLAIIVFIFAVMGMQLFGKNYELYSDRFPDHQVPRWNFTDFMHSFMIVFRILCAEWIEPMWDCLLVDGWPCIPFFLVAVTVGNLVVLNLFLALLLASFGASNLSSPQTESVDTKKLQEAIERFKKAGRFIKKYVSLFVRFILCRKKQSNDTDKKDKKCRSMRIVRLSKQDRLKRIEQHANLLKKGIYTKNYVETTISISPPEDDNNGNCGNTNSKDTTNDKSEDVARSPPVAHNCDNNSTTKNRRQSIALTALRSSNKLYNAETKMGSCGRPSGDLSSTPCASATSAFINEAMQPIKEDSFDNSSTDSNGKISILDNNDGQQEQTIGAEPTEITITIQCPVDSPQTTQDDESLHERAPSKTTYYLQGPDKEDMEEEDERDLEYIDMLMRKSICFGSLCLRWFLFRRFMRKIVEHRYFDTLILILIVVSSCTLALEDKHLKTRPTLKIVLDMLDNIFTLIFSLEMLMKWCAFGFRRYFENIWSWLDFVIVLVSFVNLMASLLGSGKIQALKTMRTLRAMRGLRPLRALSRFQGMRVVVNALIQAIPAIFNVLLVCLIFWLIFAIMGVQMFGGKFHRCVDFNQEVLDYSEVPTRQDCLLKNHTWSNPQINFDNVLNAYLALFQVVRYAIYLL